MGQQTADIVICGAGIIGAAIGWRLSQRYPDKRVVVLEKESAAGLHQTGRNSGVIHAGVYYAPGSLKARYCREGLSRTLDFCRQYQIPFEQCGKLLVATSELELQRMEALFQRCQQNGLAPQWLDKAALAKAEPNITGLGAIFIEATGITDYAHICQSMLSLFAKSGGQVSFNTPVTEVRQHQHSIQVTAGDQQYEVGLLVNASGLMSDRLIEMAELDCDFRIVPFRGEYFALPNKYRDLVNHLIYPIPDPEMPFLGVHLTRMIDGGLTVGPNAVLALAQEGYNKTDVNLADMARMLSYPGSWKVFWQHRKSGMAELHNSWSKSAYLKRVQRYCPQITRQDLLPYPSGVRAQAVSRDGQLLHDFKFVESERSLHIGNAPSPAATSALPIADAVIDKLADKL